MGFDLRATKEVKDSEKQQREGRKVREGVGKVGREWWGEGYFSSPPHLQIVSDVINTTFV